MQLGEELLAQGDVENGVEHLSLAVAVCGQPHSLLGVLQQTLPPQIYQLLLQVREAPRAGDQSEEVAGRLVVQSINQCQLFV